MIEPIYPVYLKHDLGFSRTMISIVFAIITGAFVLLMPLMGVLSDKVRPRKLMITGLLISGITAPGMVLITSLVPLAACLFIMGVGWALLIAPAFPLFTKAVEEAGSQYGIAFGLSNAFWAGGFIVGPAIGGPLTQYFGILTPLTVFSGLMLMTVAILMGQKLGTGNG
jgi:MFS family permease